jgi:predicted thioesterase
MADIPLGLRMETRKLVTKENAISFLGQDDARVLATPWLIVYLEMTCREVVKPYLLDGQDTVGTQVNVRHLASTPIGSEVRFVAEVSGVEKRRVQFRVEAWNDTEKIAEGFHERGIIDVARFAAKAAAKRPPALL